MLLGDDKNVLKTVRFAKRILLPLFLSANSSVTVVTVEMLPSRRLCRQLANVYIASSAGRVGRLPCRQSYCHGKVTVTHKNAFFCRLHWNRVVIPNAAVEAVVAQHGASIDGCISNGRWRYYLRMTEAVPSDKKSSIFGRQASQLAFRLPHCLSGRTPEPPHITSQLK